MDELNYFPDTDLDFSFTSTSTATDRTLSTSARSSLARSSITLSFNDRLSTTTATTTTISNTSTFHHNVSDPLWSKIKAVTNLSSDGKIHLSHLKLLRHIGTGNLGRVFLCHLRDCDIATSCFALKVIDKEFLSAKKLSHVQTEAEILSMLDHPFLPTLYAQIEVSHYSCLLIDYCSNGDLHSLLRKQPQNRLPIESVRFFAAEVLIALEYLHALGIVYRDLKPENVLLREDGHIMLSDFDLCFKANVVPTFQTHNRNRKRSTSTSTSNRCGCFGKINSEKEETVAEFTAEPVTAFSKSCVGTHEYLAPELLTGNGHGNGVDWWAFGVFVYELLYGKTPFKGGSKENTLRNIASTRQVEFHVTEREEEGIKEAKDLIEKLLVKDPSKRLGCTRGAQDIKRHPFFDGIKWSLIRNYKPPEVRGVVKKNKAHVTHVTGVLQRRRRRWWWWKKGVRYFMRNNKSSANSNYSNNNNYYTYVSNGNSKKVTKKHG